MSNKYGDNIKKVKKIRYWQLKINQNTQNLH